MGRTAAVRVPVLILAGLSLMPAAPAQFRDPLTTAEANQVRDTAGDPGKRVLLMLSFAQGRLARFENLRTASPRPPDRDAQLYGQLRQYAAIVPELDDAVDDMMQGTQTSETKGKTDVKKVLDQLITAETAMDDSLHQVQSDSTPADLATYRFELQDCIEVTDDSLQNAKQDAAAPHGGRFR